MFTDRDIAIRILALEENEQDPLGVLPHFDRNFDTMGSAEHSGDCTKKPWTCSRCLYEDTIKRVPGVRALFELESD